MVVQVVVRAVVLATAVLWLGACSPRSDIAATSREAPPGLEQTPDADTLFAWATELAENNLARLAAAEMLYRNHTYEHALITGESANAYHYGKYFRVFRSSAVEDIVRTSSLLRPVKYRIRYDFDVVGTQFRPGTPVDTEVHNLARADQFFTVDQKDSIVLEYESGPDSRPIDTYSPNLDRPNYWQYRGDEGLFSHYWELHDISQ